MHHEVQHIMGMPIMIDVYDAHVSRAAVVAAFDWLRRVDEMFSTYRPASEISRLNRGEISEERCSPLVRSVLRSCERLRERTDGYFDHIAAGARLSCAGSSNPPVDPSGFVKGWAVDGVAEILEQAGARNYCAEAAGDMRLAGRPADEACWRIGVRHPDDPSELVLLLETDRRCAIATSGTYERGEHIVNPRDGRNPHGVRSVTVVGAGDLATADALATAIFAMGPDGAAWAARHAFPYAAAVIDDEDRLHTTREFAAWRASDTVSRCEPSSSASAAPR